MKADPKPDRPAEISTAPPADAAEVFANSGQVDPKAFMGALAVEAGLVSQALNLFQMRLGEMLGRSELTDTDIADLQGLDQLTQRVGDLGALLDRAGRDLEADKPLSVDRLLEVAKLAHSRAIVTGLDTTKEHDTPLGEHGDPHAGDAITFF